MFPGELDLAQYLQLNLSVFLLHAMISSIAFLAACFCNESKGYFAIGAGVPVLFYLIEMLSNIGDKLEKLKYCTIFTLFPGDKILEGTKGILGLNIAMVIIAIVVFSVSVTIFKKKDLFI